MFGSGREKQRADLLSSSAASFTKTKATISPLPGLGWMPVCQRGWGECACAPSPFTTSFPTVTIFSHFHQQGYPLLREQTASQFHSFDQRSTPQWLTTVQMWGRIKKLGDRCSKLIVQLQTKPEPPGTTEDLNARSDRSSCSTGVTFASTVDVHLPCCLAE